LGVLDGLPLATLIAATLALYAPDRLCLHRPRERSPQSTFAWFSS